MDVAEWRLAIDAAVRRLVDSQALIEEYEGHKWLERLRKNVEMGIYDCGCGNNVEMQEKICDVKDL